MKFKNYIENSTLLNKLENLESFDDIKQVLINNKIEFLTPKTKKPIIIFEIDGESYVYDDYLYSTKDWIHQVNAEDYISTIDFNQDFWRQVNKNTVVYHGTTESNWLEIQQSKELSPKFKTRGISNRHIGPAIFASTNYDSALNFYPVILSIQVGKMKNSGYMPEVEQEPETENYNKKMALAHLLSLDDFYIDLESGMMDDTIIFRQPIPLIYISKIK